MGEHGMNPWRAGCAETCSSGSEGGPRKRTGREAGTAPRSDPYSYLRCWEGVVFFSFVIDVFSRKIVGWQFASHMRTTLVLDALRMALSTRHRVDEVRLVHHSDRGSQYVSGDYSQTLEDHDVLASVGSTGDAYDNSMAESFVDSFKTELIADRVWRTRSQLELAIVEYIAWFNDSRLHENLGDRPPREIEELYAVKSRTPTPTS
jgi:putative transposase